MRKVILDDGFGRREVVDVSDEATDFITLRYHGVTYTRVGHDEGGQHLESGKDVPLWIYRRDV